MLCTGIPSEEKVAANADEEADSSKKEVGPSANNTIKKVSSEGIPSTSTDMFPICS
jgi:hypothetical protein